MTDSNLIRAGVAQKKITPALGSNLGGYPYRRVAKTVRSDLYARAMVFDDGRKKVAVVSTDLVAVTAEIVEPAKATIERQCGIDPGAVMICATHTHTGPEIRYRRDLDFGPDPQYNADLSRNIAAAVEEACGAMFDAGLYLGETEAAGYTFNKIWRTRDGNDVYHNPGGAERPEDLLGPAGPLDTSVQVLAVRDGTKRLRGMMVNFAAHPNSKGDDIWAEWPGETARCIAAVYGDDVPCLVLQGTSGDNDCIKSLRRENVGKGIAGAAMMAIERAENPPPNPPVVDFRCEILPIPYCIRTPELNAAMEALRKRDDLKPLERAGLRMYDTWDKDGKTASVPVQCLRVGDAAFVALPAEVFAALGLEIKRYSPAKKTFVATCANEKFGYVPPADQAHRGAYGEKPAQARQLVAEAGRMMVDSAVKSLHQMWNR